MDVHLRDLRYFVAVAEELSFTRAAERLHVSQPALSKQIRLLERALRAALLRRDRRTVTLTAAGEALLPRAQRLLADWSGALGEVSRASTGERMVLQVGVHTSIRIGMVDRIAQRFAEVLPGWRIAPQESDWGDASAGLLSGAVDAALIWLPVPEPEQLSHRVLLAEPRWVALPAGHRLADRTEIDFAELADERFVALPASAGLSRDFWLGIDGRGGRPVTVALEAHSAAEAVDAIVAGLGIALIAGSNSGAYPEQEVVCRPVRGLKPCRLAAVWRREDSRPSVRAFLRACAEERADGPA